MGLRRRHWRQCLCVRLFFIGYSGININGLVVVMVVGVTGFYTGFDNINDNYHTDITSSTVVLTTAETVDAVNPTSLEPGETWTK